MAKFSVNILGCGSATPSLRHQPACQIVDFRDTLYMIDCGEGAQLQMRRMKMRFSHLRHIFISHLHGDHLLGLPGLLSTLSLHETSGEIHIYIFEEGIRLIRDILAVVLHASTFNIVFHPIGVGRAVIYEDDAMTVSTFPLYHTAPAVGFIFREKPKARPLRKDMIEFLNVPVRARAAIKRGADYVKPDGEVVANSRLTTDPGPSHSYAYCSDTRFEPAVVDDIKGVDTVYHEATYADDKADKAAARGHSTARQAGRVARMAGARRLVIGHFSKSYTSDIPMLEQAREEFHDVTLANEGLTIDLYDDLSNVR